MSKKTTASYMRGAKCGVALLAAILPLSSGCGGGGGSSVGATALSFNAPQAFTANTRIIGRSGLSVGVNDAQQPSYFATPESTAQLLATPTGAVNFGATAVNDLSQIVGYVNLQAGGDGIYWASPTAPAQILASPANVTSTTASGINHAGQIVGSSFIVGAQVNSGIQRALYWSNPTAQPQQLALFGADTKSDANYITNSGLIVGASIRSFGSVPVIWTSPTAQPQSPTPISGEVGFPGIGAVADSGLIVGTVVASNFVSQATTWSSVTATPQQLPVLPAGNGKDSSALTVNSNGVIGGFANVTSNTTHAVIWSNGQVYDLNDLIPADSGWVLERVNFITDQNVIYGVGRLTTNGNSFNRNFVLTPK